MYIYCLLKHSKLNQNFVFIKLLRTCKDAEHHQPLGENQVRCCHTLIRMGKSEKPGKVEASESLESGCSYQSVKEESVFYSFREERFKTKV